MKPGDLVRPREWQLGYTVGLTRDSGLLSPVDNPFVYRMVPTDVGIVIAINVENDMIDDDALVLVNGTFGWNYTMYFEVVHEAG